MNAVSDCPTTLSPDFAVTVTRYSPASVIAGIMGMNFQPAFFSDERLYWVLLAMMAAIALGTLVFARLRRWI